jgi:hypothetical protein
VICLAAIAFRLAPRDGDAATLQTSTNHRLSQRLELLNTTTRPFNKALARQAVIEALDRNALQSSTATRS